MDATRARCRGRHPARNDAWKTQANAAMDRYASGDDAAFSELYDAVAPRLYTFALRQTRDAEVAADLVQQAFLQIHSARSHFVRNAEVMPWAFAIVRRLIIDRVRRLAHEPVVSGADVDDDCPSSLLAYEPAPDELVERKQLRGDIERHLSRVPAANRAAFDLVKNEELSMGEAAEVLGTTVTAVKLRAHRAYVALRLTLAREWGRGPGNRRRLPRT